MQDDFKRKTREFKERQGESQMLETLYQVGMQAGVVAHADPTSEMRRVCVWGGDHMR